MSIMSHKVARFSVALIAVASIVMAGVLFQTLRPYNLVTFPQGNVGTVEPKVVEAGGTIRVTFPEFCNEGVDVTVLRWAEVLVDDVVVASFELPSVSFNAPPEPVCFSPVPQTVVLPNYVVGQSVTDLATFRLHNEITYRPNPFQKVSIFTVTEPFQIRP